MDRKKEQKLSEISELLNSFKDDEFALDPYVLKYLSLEELDAILAKLLEKREGIIENNRDWFMQFRKDML